MANDWSDLNQQAEHEEEVEAENEPKWEKAKKDPKAIYSYVGKGGSRRVSHNNCLILTHNFIHNFKVNGGKNRKAQLASSTEHIQLPHVKRLTKGKENLEPESEPEIISETVGTSVESELENLLESTVQTETEPVVADIVTLEEVPEEEELESQPIQLSILLADEAASEKAREQRFQSEITERTNIPRPLGGPVTLLNDKYLLVNQITEGLCPKRFTHAWKSHVTHILT